MRKFVPRDIQWLSSSCSMTFPFSEGCVPIGKTISLWNTLIIINTYHLLNTCNALGQGQPLIIAIIYWILAMLLGKDSFTSVWPMQYHRSHAQKGSALGFMLCCCHLENFSNFWTRCPVFAFCTGPHKLCSWSWLLVFIYSQSPTYKRVLFREHVHKSNLFVSPAKLA